MIVIDFLPSGTPARGDPVDAVIDLQGVAYVTDNIRIYAFDFLERDSSNALAFLDRVGAPLTSPTATYGQAWDMDIDSMNALYIIPMPSSATAGLDLDPRSPELADEEQSQVH